MKVIYYLSKLVARNNIRFKSINLVEYCIKALSRRHAVRTFLILFLLVTKSLSLFTKT